MGRHCWYLDQTLVPLALLGPDLCPVEREKIAKTLFSKPVPNKFHHSKSNVFKDHKFKQETSPALAPLMGEDSWFIFSLLNLTKMEVKLWLYTPSSLCCFVDSKSFPTFSIG